MVAALFVMGAVLDAVWTLLVKFIADGRALGAAVCQVVFTALATLAVWMVVEGAGWSGVVWYSVGGGVGTWAVTKWSR